ncbi:toll/interleukin-1 receptor domain-containing protein [Frankia sp. AiPs1]|uniref:toll/interleukin-1 receptor domain-containing protein n=1 Tax=Frankia sp. AiPs1 TaxID=573493 RepID=UPI0020444165|nr:toll/interleukin-1 receptor domain-containing protein [Frankia sp. AiPs1]MCM3921057.1 toll/interleukin-1 receptor domain-containing protein [Frankia sp. AiPs1]
MTEGATQGGRDFFVSYTQVDRAWAEWVAWELEAAGFTVTVQAWDMLAGDHWLAKVDDAVRGSAHTLAVVSADYLDSDWARAELLAALRGDPLSRGRTLLPVRIADVRDRGLLGSMADIDLFEVDEQVAREQLVTAARAVRTGDRGKPEQQPAFPVRETGGARFPGGGPPQVWRMPWPPNRCSTPTSTARTSSCPTAAPISSTGNWLSGVVPSTTSRSTSTR